ncbi:MAG: LptA/OstA family protein [Puniceicoccales bacterium]|nr:LptA/OstA family protein [Puniceicoccales bacterium]
MFQRSWLVADDVFSEISSNRLEISPMDGHMEFKFSGDVRIKTTEFQASADRMVVVAKAPKGTKAMASSPSFDAIESIVAEGNATMRQGERSGSADRVEINTGKNEIFLIGNAKVSDSSGTVCGDMKINYRTKSVEVMSSEGGRAAVQINATEGLVSIPESIAKSDVNQDVTNNIDS